MINKLTAVILAAVLAFGFGCMPVSAAAKKTVLMPVTGRHIQANAYSVLKLVNSERAGRGYKKLKWNRALETAALKRAKEISVRFSHTRPNGRAFYTVIKKSERSGFYTMGENIAAGDTSASAVMDGWMNSPRHHENILKAGYTHIGVACVKAGDSYYWVQCFSGGRSKSGKKLKKNGGFTAEVEIKKKAYSMSLTCGGKRIAAMTVGQTCATRLEVTGRENFSPAAAAKGQFNWSSSDPSVISVDKKGNLTALGGGTVTITAAAKNKTVKFKQTVTAV